MVDLYTWEFLIQREIKQGGKISLPDGAKEVVATDHLLKGPVVHWNIDHEQKYAVLSLDPLRNEAYTHIDARKIYGIDSVDEDGGYIRPPEQITDFWPVDLTPDSRIYFLTHQRMIRSDNPSIYLLSEHQLLELLPTKPTSMDPGAKSSSDALFEVPGFTGDR